MAHEDLPWWRPWADSVFDRLEQSAQRVVVAASSDYELAAYTTYNALRSLPVGVAVWHGIEFGSEVNIGSATLAALAIKAYRMLPPAPLPEATATPPSPQGDGGAHA